MKRFATNMTLIPTLLLLLPPTAAMPEVAREAAGATTNGVFERLKTLEGTWIGRSTKGWTEEVTYKVIAGGSVVMSLSFDAHPGEQMVTMYHLDGERLLLTHYCVAKNQPRLMATSVEENGRKVTFTFLDGTGMKSRDAGHMDSLVMQFHDNDRFTSQWTWYQDGASSWMEEIEMVRKR